jgi:polygalacturonase
MQTAARWLATAAVLAAGVAPAYAAKVCAVRDFGAKGDGTTKDTAAIQKAIDTCAAARGGGTVKLEGGVFVSAPLLLKSHVTLDVMHGATLLGSPDHADYPKKREFNAPGYQALLSSVNAEDVSIISTGTGGEPGTIDGNGRSWWESIRGTKDAGLLGSENTRPRLIVFDHTKHVKMDGVNVKNSPYWQIVPYYADDVTIRNVRITADLPSPNTDAIDPFSSSNVLIEHVYADVGDDDVAIKSGMVNSPGPDAPSKNIIVRDCVFEHGHGVSIGSELAGGAQNILVERVSFKGTDNGVRVKANRDRGNDVGNIVFRDITMDGVKTAVLISEYYPKTLPTGEVAPEPVQRLTPHFHDITVENLTATNINWAGVVVGLPEAPALNILLKNVSITAQRGMTFAYAHVTTDNLKVVAADGKPLTEGAGVVLTKK